MSKLSWVNVALRGIMETAIILAFCYWGYHIGKSTGMKILFAVSIPVVVFGFWGLVDFHNMGGLSESLRLIQELVVSGLAAFVLYITGAGILGLLLAGISVIHHLLVYALGETLLKQ